ncbi:MAG: glycoside hydrolase [Chitinophagaceae bacterium]|nr:glycoside hydrolase [Chitinophagaceae bacterium]
MKRTIALLPFLLCAITLFSQVNESQFSQLKWRMIGPHRGGRTVGAVGVPQQPNVFYIGVNNGGVWKTTDFGRTWNPIFDDQSTGSIGDVAVAPSDPNILYAGSGEGLQRPDLSVGNGMYRSNDAGKTWKWLGLKEVQQIGGLAVHPTDPNTVFVAALGHPYGPNEERGVYRSSDGGKTWSKSLYIDENTGAIQVSFDPNDPNTLYADMWAGRQGPWENGAWNGENSGLFKSTDGGKSWKKLTNGLPTTAQGLGRIGFCIAPSNSKRIYATVDAGKEGGIYRSDDAGENWKLIQADNRFWGRGSDFAEIKADPKNENIVYTANVVTWRSEDGGYNWTAFRGAPGGDDYHRIWINPNNSGIILIASDQGAIITVNGGQTFSSWYNQPTAQFYHVSTDNAFPYNVYGGQQESGSVGIASRGNDGAVTFREWHPVGVEEYGYVAVDPLDDNIIYGGKISRFDKRTGQVQNISPQLTRGGNYRFLRTAPVLFSPIDKKTLYFAGNVLFKTTSGGKSWEVISPDLSREAWDIPASVGIYTNAEMKAMPRRGVIYTIAPSFMDINTIWCGTDDGLIHLTRDGGKHWTNVTPTAITSWSKVSLMEASHFDNNAAYAAVNRIRCDDMKPHIYKTSDAGKTWTEIVNGLPEDPINAVREDPTTKGLLYAGSETAVYFSLDDGGHWQTLRQNMPATSIRDLVVKDNDIVVGTHGRSFWVLDDISLLRQLAREKITGNYLFKPATATRVRWSMYTDTPLPQEEPAGENPPDGAILDYYLSNKAAEVQLDIYSKGKDGPALIHHYSSKDSLYEVGPVNIPLYWIRPQQILSTNAGHHRFCWDMKYQPLNLPPSYPIGANYMNTAPEATAPWVMPGNYVVRLTVDGQSMEKEISVRMDPRVKTSGADLQMQHDLSLACYEKRKASMELVNEIRRFRVMLRSQMTNAENRVVEELNKKDKLAKELEEIAGRMNSSYSGIFSSLQEADMAPTNVMMKAVLVDLQKQWTILIDRKAGLK